MSKHIKTLIGDFDFYFVISTLLYIYLYGMNIFKSN